MKLSNQYDNVQLPISIVRRAWFNYKILLVPLSCESSGRSVKTSLSLHKNTYPPVMGSLDNACLTGFICRICCDLNKVVIHAFSEEADKIDLVCLMEDYLGVDVYLNDNLPKTVCLKCAKKLRKHYEWMQLIKRAQATIKSRREARALEEATSKNSELSSSPEES